MRILLAEDNEINQKMTRALLTRQGHVVDIANNGAQAVAAVKRTAYDLVFMDVQMPEMDGFEAAQTIRELEANSTQTGQHLPIIAMTAHALHGDRQRCMDAGMDDYVSKPLDPRKVFQAIERWSDPSASRLTTGELRSVESRLAGLDGILPDEWAASKTVDHPDDEALSEEDVILDIDSALNRFGDDRDFYYNLIIDFLSSLPVRLAEMRAAIDAGDLQNLSLYAHNLKGVSANFSALRLARLSTVLDDDCRAGNAAGARKHLVELEFAAVELDAHARERMGNEPA
jgi:CheY-like chemotaxis protein/HPt (histidine-containing phosphotransfer) domain-containing protein